MHERLGFCVGLSPPRVHNDIAVPNVSKIMKHIRLLFVLAAGLVASSLLTTRSLAAAPTNLGHPEAELIRLEIQKGEYLFGTPAQRQIALQMFDPEFQGIGYGPTGQPVRENYETIRTLITLFPMLPPGTITWADWRVLQVGTNTYVLSYVAIGPGPTGDVVAFYESSTWTWRGGSWKTLFFHQTLIPAP